MMFEVAAESYARYMGRFSEPLAEALLELAPPVGPALDVGCGPGALTQRLVDRLGVDGVVGVDPSASFVAAARSRLPGVDIRHGTAEHLPFDDDSAGSAYAALVVHFMADPVAGLREMARVVRPGGVIAATVWDHAGGTGPLSPLWDVVRLLDPAALDESDLAGARQGQLVDLATSAGLVDVAEHCLTVVSPYGSFEEWWEPYTLGVGPAGAHVASLTDQEREQLQQACRAALPEGPFEISASAWTLLSRSR